MNDIPNATTVAFFRERLRKANVIDATLVSVPKQRNSREDNKEIKANRLPDRWNESSKHCSKRIWMRAEIKKLS